MRELIEFVGMVFSIAIFARVIVSWFPTSGNNPIVVFIYTVTEPILAPIRRIIPRMGTFDLTPMIALILIIIIQRILVAAIG